MIAHLPQFLAHLAGMRRYGDRVTAGKSEQYVAVAEPLVLHESAVLGLEAELSGRVRIGQMVQVESATAKDNADGVVAAAAAAASRSQCG